MRTGHPCPDVGFSYQKEVRETMAKQRGHGEGSIYQRKDGRWAASLTLEGGKRKRKTFYGKTRKEVQDKLNTALHAQKQGMLVTGPQQTLKQYLEHWLEEVHRPTIRAGTYKGCRDLLILHILPALGRFPLQKLTPQHIQAFYTQKTKEGYSASTIRQMHAMLHKAMDKAVLWNLVARNPCDGVSPPRRQHYEIKPLTLEQCLHFLAAAKGHPLEALFVLALVTGMRRGELVGLKWQDINLADNTLQIKRIVTRKPGGGHMEAETKTAQSRRTVVLVPFATEALKRHQIHQKEARLKAGEAWIEHNLVFCTPRGDYLGEQVLVPFKRLLKTAGLPNIRFHDLRHSTATLLLSIGVHPKVVQETLGHSEIGITMNIYSHVLPTMQRDAMARLTALLQADGS
jgi:integrase